MSKLIRVSIWATLILCLVLPIKAAEANITNGMVNLDLLGPTTAFRVNGSPRIENFPFVSDFGGPATLKVTNGSLEDSFEERVSSSVIKLNSQVIIGPSEFNKNVYLIEKDVLLTKGNNSLEVELRGKPGGRITFQLIQSVSNVCAIPSDIVFDGPGTSSQITVIGNLIDGTEVNITGSSCGTTYLSSGTQIAIVTIQGLVSAVAPGSAVITVVNDFFTATVSAVVNGSHPSISNISLYPTSLPVPNVGEQFIQTLVFDYKDQNGEIDRLDITLVFPDGTSKSSSQQFPEPVDEGTYLRRYLVDDSFTAGVYQFEIEAFDSQGNRSGVNTATFNVSETAERILEISSITPSQGAPGDVIVFEGRGFATVDPSENKIQFQRLARADILSVSADRMEVVVPVGALTGPVVLATPAGRTQSPMEFSVNPTMDILPAVGRLLTGQTVAFTIAQSGLRSSEITCSINDQIEPDPTLGILDSVHSGFFYTSPQTVPLENPLRFRCEANDAPGVFAAMEIEIVAPVPPPGSAHIAASHGGTIESVQGDVILSIPAGALTTDTFITVEQLNPDVFAIPTDDANNHAAIRFEPTGIQFTQPVTVTFPLRNWMEPGSQLPLYLFNEGTGDLTDTGSKAITDESGLRATASIDHFSTYAAREPLTTEQILARQAVKDLVVTNPFLLSEFAITLSPEMPLMEGLSVPVLVKRRDGALPGLGPFTEASSLTVSVAIEGYPGADTPASLGPIIQPTPDGWELGTIINLSTLPDCGAGNTTRGELTISYEKIDIEDRVSIPFTIQCLDELIFSGTEPPDFVPIDILPSLGDGNTYEHNGLQVSQHQDGTYIVEMMYPGQIYRFSTVDVGNDGILTYTPRQPPGSAVNAPFMLEVTGDVRVAGTISLAGHHGIKGEDGGTACGDCGGEGAIGTSLNSGAGGHGGDYFGPCDAVCCGVFEYLGVPCPENVTFHSGQNGQGSIDWPYGGGQGGIAWEKIKLQDILKSIPSFALNAGACVGGAPGACFSAAIAIGDIYGAADGMANNDLNYVRSAGEGGGNNGANAPLDIAYFNPPIAGGGGGGAGKAEIFLEDDEAGGGGGGGGGAAANLKLVVGGRVTIEPGGFIYGQGGWGGYGGNGEDGEAAPGGGGGGGSGSAVHIIALKGVANNDLITAPGGIGGRSGGISKDIGAEYTLALVNSAFGRNGYNGRLRVDGPFNGADPIAMPFYRGPRLTNRVGVSMNRFSSAASGFFFPGDFFASYRFIPETFETSGLNTFTAVVRNIYTADGRQYDHTITLHPWQKGFVFYFPGLRDTDRDGLSDGLEDVYGSDPNNSDSDWDGLSDGDEVFVHKTDPANADTDGDGSADGDELDLGSDPLNAASTPEVCDGSDNDLDGLTDERCPANRISGGASHTLSIKSDGTLWAWGENNYGRLGDGTTTWSSIPVPSNSGNDWASVSAGYFHSLGLKTDGTLWSWGYNYQCQLGLGGDCPGTDRYIPTQIGTDDDWVMASAGEIHGFGLKSDGTLWAWGDNYWSQLGDGSSYTEQQSSPVPIGDNQWVMVSGKNSHTLGLKRDGSLWAWGTTVPESGLGDGITTGSIWPMRIGDENDWCAVSAGNQYSMALKSDGTLWAWGSNGFGQLGDGTTEPSKVPIQIGVDDDWVMLSTGTYHNLALKSDGTLWSWGWNYYGQLGDGTTTDRYVPVQIDGDKHWVMVSAGDFHSLALDSDGALWVWGYNFQGQLGDGTQIDEADPKPIDW